LASRDFGDFKVILALGNVKAKFRYRAVMAVMAEGLEIWAGE
jgi:hypothetical protein